MKNSYIFFILFDFLLENMENWKQRIVLKPMEIRKGFEVAVVKCPKAFVTEIRMVFPGQDLDGVLAVLTCQKSKLDLCELGEDIAKEKDELLESFYDEAKRVSGALTKLDHWCDFIDPCSGLPVSIYTLLNLCVSLFLYAHLFLLNRHFGSTQIVVTVRWTDLMSCCISRPIQQECAKSHRIHDGERISIQQLCLQLHRMMFSRRFCLISLKRSRRNTI